MNSFIPPLPKGVNMTVDDWQGEMFEVESSSSPEPQMVNHFLQNGNIEESWSCTCPDFHYRKRECKHIKAAKEYLEIFRMRYQEVSDAEYEMWFDEEVE